MGVFWSAAGGANWPIATYCPSLGPFPSVGGGAHRPLTTLCPSSPSLTYLSLSTSLPFPLGGCTHGAPGLSLFHCSVSGPHRGGQLPLPLARCVSLGTPIPAVGNPSPTAAFGPQDVRRAWGAGGGQVGGQLSMSERDGSHYFSKRELKYCGMAHEGMNSIPVPHSPLYPFPLSSPHPSSWLRPLSTDPQSSRH